MFRKDLGSDGRVPRTRPIIATDLEGSSAQMAADVLRRELSNPDPNARRNRETVIAKEQLVIANPLYAVMDQNTPID